MTGNRHGDGIGGASSGHRPNCFRRTDTLRYFSVARGRAGRNFAQSFPDPLLKGSATHIERKVQTELRCFHKSNHLSNDALKLSIATYQLRFGETVLKVLDEFVGI